MSDTRLLVLDIEGTTTSIAFVYETLFPFARRELASFVKGHWDAPAVREAAALMGADSDAEACIGRALALMDGDVKDTGLKALQGLIWEAGYRASEMKGHVYPDVPLALALAHERGLLVAIYSSGSVAAQKLLFGHSEAGDLTPYLSGYFDTTTGPKKEAASYLVIAAHFGFSPDHCVFVTDNPDEAVAAGEAGMQVYVAERPGNPPLPEGHGFHTVHTLTAIPFLNP